ncbi:hypothetical protein DASC09_037520 [Saccharomycopsis crataegensis]|uniref:Homeobox domain-containing protein n=1 Tax=Saccharomycopsis crataegensis TaxID=43959 RepID=A0AAV5QPI2_9ASCO|nr:hypothetical protein DASC09_037520 [Saccharomycopsis crataegensis]
MDITNMLSNQNHHHHHQHSSSRTLPSLSHAQSHHLQSSSPTTLPSLKDVLRDAYTDGPSYDPRGHYQKPNQQIIHPLPSSSYQYQYPASKYVQQKQQPQVLPSMNHPSTPLPVLPSSTVTQQPYHCYPTNSYSTNSTPTSSSSSSSSYDPTIPNQYSYPRSISATTSPSSVSSYSANYMSDSSKRKRRQNLPKTTTDVLLNWLKQNLDRPYPNSQEKNELVAQTGLTFQQLDNWFINARRRKVKNLKELRSRNIEF